MSLTSLVWELLMISARALARQSPRRQKNVNVSLNQATPRAQVTVCCPPFSLF